MSHLENSLHELYILSNPSRPLVTRRALIRNSDRELPLALKEIFINIVSNNLRINAREERDRIAKNTIDIAKRVIAAKSPAGIRATLLRGGSAANLNNLAELLGLLLDQIEDRIDQEVDEEAPGTSGGGVEEEWRPKSVGPTTIIEKEKSVSTNVAGEKGKGDEISDSITTPFAGPTAERP